MAYGLNYKQQTRFCSQLAEIIGIEAEIISLAMDEVTRVELLRVCKNEREGEQ